MKSTFSTLAATALFASCVVAQNFMVNTPQNAIVCEPLSISWTGGSPPFFMSILPGSDPTGTPLESFPNLTSSPFTWKVDQPVGSSLGITMKDNNGLPAQSGAFPVLTGPDTSCVGATTSGGATSTDSSTTGGATGTTSAVSTSTSVTATTSVSTAPGTSTTTGGTTTPVGTGSASSPSGTSPSSSSHPSSSGGSASSASHSSSGSAASTTPSNAAQLGTAAHFGVAGIIGAALAAILA